MSSKTARRTGVNANRRSIASHAVEKTALSIEEASSLQWTL
jgi:hypothetical protein